MYWLPGPSSKLHHGSAEIGRRQCLKHFTLAIEESDAGRAIHFVGAPCGEVDVQSVEIHFEVRHGLACVKHEHAPTSWRGRIIGAMSVIAPVVLPTCVTATIFVRSVITSSAVSERTRPSSSKSNHLSVAPVRSASSWNGSSTEWCSALVTTISSPGFNAKRLAVSPRVQATRAECGGQQVQSCGGAGGDDDLLFAFRRIGANQLGHFGARILERMVLRAASSCAPRCTPALMVR